MKILGIRIKKDKIIKALVIIASISLLITGLLPLFL